MVCVCLCVHVRLHVYVRVGVYGCVHVWYTVMRRLTTGIHS